MRIAILGWGSLLWEGGPEFDRWHDEWQLDGPTLRLEFSRISSSRLGALTLVIDGNNGAANTVAWCASKRKHVEDAVADLRCREGCSIRDIAYVDLAAEGPQPESVADVASWGRQRRLDFVLWTALRSNFEIKTGGPFTVPAALAYVRELKAEGKAKAADYIWRAPDFVQTPLRAALQQPPWFSENRRQ
jgi:hypothetical protein